jgi:prolyl-tRNA synthetase
MYFIMCQVVFAENNKLRYYFLMKQSKLFTKTRKEAPKDEVAKNAQLLIRAGYIHKEMAGAYAILPLGLRVLKKIENIIREEMNMLGGQEIEMTALQGSEVWSKTGRWSDEVIDVWFKPQLKSGADVGLATTHEEPLTAILSEYVNSYRDLPQYVYQFQTKFRNELRAKSGILRGREFIMKDLYSFSKDEAEHNEFYEKSKVAYTNVFNRAGIGHVTYMTFASGGSFSKYSHEFQTLTDAGEDIIYLNKKAGIAINKEVFTPEVLAELGHAKEDFTEEKAIEVGNIFSLGVKFSEPIGLSYTDEQGEKKTVIMGSYGIGLGRLMGTIVEVLADDKGIVWPESVAPFAVHLIEIGSKDESVKERAEKIYKTLEEKNIEVLYDDRDARAGEKFADADLIGIPYQVIVSERGNAEGTVEVKNRKTGEVKIVKEEGVLTGTIGSLFS